jgi:integrase
MANTTKPLQDTEIKNAKPKDKNYTLSDGYGLQLNIKVNGSKLWEFRFNSPITNKRRKTSLGTYPSVSLKNARDKRTNYLNLIHSGIDPIDHYQSIKEEQKKEESKIHDTIESIANKQIEKEQHNKQLKDKTVTKAKNRLKNHFYSHLPQKGNTLIHSITYNQIVKILELLEHEEKLDTLDRVKSQIIKIYQYAYSENIISDVTIYAKLELKGFKQYQEGQASNRATLTRKEDIQTFYNNILNYPYNLITKYLLLFSIHTAQRQGSIILTKWEHINFEEKLWTIPKENMKGRATKVKEHTIPLTDIVIKYLKELNAITGGNEYIFPNSQINKSRNKYPHISNNTANSAIRKMGYTKEQQTAHGLRAMFKTICKEHQETDNLNNEFVERTLAHKVDGDVEGAYNRAANIEDIRKVLDWWSSYLEKLKEKGK